MADSRSPEDELAGATAGAVAADEGTASRAEQRQLELRIRAQNRALRQKELELLATVEQLQEKEEAAARLAYLAQEESRKLEAALADLHDAQQTLRASEEKFRAVAESAMDGIVSANADGTIVYANPGASASFGHAAGGLVGQPITSLMPARFREAHRRGFSRFVRTGKGEMVGRMVELTGLRRDGREFPLELSLSHWSTREGVFFTAVLRDITERKEAEAALAEAHRRLEQKVQERTRELSQALEELQKASRLKDEFLATLSHELRTPLNAILGWSTMLKSGALDAEATARAVDTIHRNANSQAQLISDILDMSGIIAGKLRLSVRPVEPVRIVEAALDTIRPAADAKEILLTATLDPRAGPVLADPDRLQQVLWNLLTNAVKFTPRGGRIEVTVRRVDADTELEVRDTGAGIPADFLPHVFERFRQADSSSTRRYGGLGLGLAIVRHLVDLHGGSVAVASAGEGQGSCFTVRLPLMTVASAGPRAAGARAEDAPARPGGPTGPVRSLEGVRVLVVEDEPDGRELVSAILGAQGAQVLEAPSVAEGLRLLDEQSPQVLLCDLEMPEEDGYQFIATVRRLAAGKGGRIPAAALTAYARTEDRVRALGAGFDMHIPKPVTPEELVLAVHNLFLRASGGER